MTPQYKTKEYPKLTTRHWLLLITSLGIAGLVCFGFGGFHPLPGIGMTAVVVTITGIAIGAIGKHARPKASNITLILCGLLLSLCYALYANPEMRLLNLPVMFGALLLGLYDLSGVFAHGIDSLHAVFQALRQWFVDSFEHFLSPIRSASQLRLSQPEHLKGLVIGLCSCIPLLIIVLPLLASSDMVFSARIQDMVQGFRLPEILSHVWRLALTMFFGFMLFSWLFSISLSPEPDIRHHKQGTRLPSMSIVVMLTVLNLVYAVFVYIQINHLFGGAHHAAMSGGWAQYARKGFFELVFVSLINLSLTGISLRTARENILVRILSWLILGMTSLILASAAWRMSHYVHAFALSLLRLLTLWGMLAIIMILIGLALHLLRPIPRLFPALVSLVLGSWVALNLMGPVRLVSHWNAHAYKQGSILHLDERYLANLSVDSLPALQKTLAPEQYQSALHLLQQEEAPPWYAWSASWLALDDGHK